MAYPERDLLTAGLRPHYDLAEIDYRTDECGQRGRGEHECWQRRALACRVAGAVSRHRPGDRLGVYGNRPEDSVSALPYEMAAG